MVTAQLFPGQDEIRAFAQRARTVKIGVLGDFCIDAYWFIDPEREEWSVETGKRVQHVRRQRYTPGAAGNVVANLAALGVGHIETFGVIGPDLYGYELARLLRGLGATTDSLCVQPAAWDTPVYGKPCLGNEELQRLDFGAFNCLSDEAWQQVLDSVRAARGRLDFLVVNQQLPQGWCDARRAQDMADELTRWQGRHLVDARQFAGLFGDACYKLNEREAARMAGRELPADGRLTDEQVADLFAQSGGTACEPRFITRGERGMAVAHAGQVAFIPGVAITGPTDPVGAGDTATATLAACLACGIAPAQAAVLSNLAASVTVRKLNQTGTASESELLSAARSLSYVFNPLLADDPRRAVHFRNADLEIVEPPPAMNLRFAVFDHDGTISTLRQGWEAVMAPVMVKAILGEHYQTADTALFERVRRRAHEFVEQTTGIQTILQMDGLVEMVAEFGLVPESERLDAFGYKAVYNDALMEMVNDRMARVQRGELAPSDFIMKGAILFLEALRARGVTLFLASGTDEADVIREAEALGYAGLFDGGIYGAKPGSRADSKEAVIRDIIARIQDAGPGAAGAGFLVAGDGPVEIRLARRLGGLALGVASDEARRFGWNDAKRRRVIRAGAHAVLPDFSQWQMALDFLFGG